MTSNGYRDTQVSLHRRFSVEANATPLLSSREEQSLTRRIETARRRLLAALAVWPGCVPRLLAACGQSQSKICVVIGVQDANPPADETALTALIAQRIAALDAASVRYLDSLAVAGWVDAETGRRRRRVAALLSSLRVHPHWLAQLVAHTYDEGPPAFDMPVASVRDCIAAAHATLLEEKQRMVRANLRLVIAMARRYHNSHVAPADLIQEGNLGLLRAVEKFDYRRGCKFSTYAIWWIQRAIVLEITMQRSILSVPAYALQAAQRMVRRSAERRAQGDPAGRFEELAATEVMTHADLRAAQRACLPAVPLHGDVDDERAPINILEDESQDDPCELLQQLEMRQGIHRALSRLPARHADILRLRYGIGSNEPHTLDAIGRQFGLSRERIRQIEQQALAQLRTSSQRCVLGALLGTQREGLTPRPQIPDSAMTDVRP